MHQRLLSNAAMNLGKRITQARARARMTQLELARAVGVSQQVINNLERRGSSSSRYTAQIAAALRVSAEWLATGKGGMQASEAQATYALAPTVEAIEVAKAWERISPELRASLRDLIFYLSSTQRVAPWLRLEMPKSPNYLPWEDHMAKAYDREVKQLQLDLEK